MGRENASDLVTNARNSEKPRKHEWWKTLNRVMENLGWSDKEALVRLEKDGWFRREVIRRAEDQFLQGQMCALRSVDFYEPWLGPPPYLYRGNFRAVARLRCGAETWAHDKWRAETRCRVCLDELETMAHVLACAKVSWNKLSCGDPDAIRRWIDYNTKR